MITAPKGRGWSVVTCTREGDEAVRIAMSATGDESGSRERRWATLRKLVSQGRRLPRNF